MADVERDWRKVGTAVRETRLRLGLTQQALSSTSGVSAATIRKIENGQPANRPLKLRAIERTLRWPPGAIDQIADGGPVPESRPDPTTAGIEELTQLVLALADRLAALERRVGP